MESVPQARPSEWDKRLSSSSPFRTVSVGEQLQPSVSPQQHWHASLAFRLGEGREGREGGEGGERLWDRQNLW